MDLQGRKLQKTGKNFVMRKLKNVTDHFILLGDAVKDDFNEQRMVGNRKSYSTVVCTVA